VIDPPGEVKSLVGESDDEIDFRELFRRILKHDRGIAGTMGICLALALGYCLVTPKVWQAQVSIKLPANADNSSLLQQLSVPEGNNSDLMSTYLEIAQSTNVAKRAVEAVGLTASAEYADEYAEAGLTAVAETLQKQMTVTKVSDSTILTIQVRARDRQLVARLADALAQGFIDANLDFSRIGARSRRVFIEDEIKRVKTQLNSDEEQLREFSSKNKSLTSLGQITSPGGDSNPAIDPLVKLKNDIIYLKMERAELSSRFNADHPAIQNIDAQIKAAESQFDHAMGKFPTDTMDYNRLSRDLKVGEGVYVVLLGELQEARINENANDTSIVVVDGAETPTAPIAPRKGRIILLALLASGILSLAFVLAWDHFRQEVDGEEELAKRSGLPLLVLIPNFRLEKNWRPELPKKSGNDRDLHSPAHLIDQTSFANTYYAESFKILKTNLFFAGLGPKRKTVAIISANRGEGKTLCNANLAVALAQSGKRVLLCDADFRKPTVHKIFGVKARADQGLPLLLSGQGSLDQMVLAAETKNLWLLPCGVRVPNPVELLESENFQSVIDGMKKKFDYVVFDAAPVLPVTDSVLLASKLDGVVLAARYGVGRLIEVESAVKRLRKGDPRFFGCILNAVDMQKYSYGYGYREGYYSYEEKK
jgi:tyrosine-protein kinase Etk/Wzc